MNSIKMPKMWAVRSQETLKVRTGGHDRGCVPGEDGWELYPKQVGDAGPATPALPWAMGEGTGEGVQGMNVEDAAVYNLGSKMAHPSPL